MIERTLFSDDLYPQRAVDFILSRISIPHACRLNHKWHSVLPRIPESNVYRNRYAACYGLEYDATIWAVAIWTSPVNQYFDISKTLELRRMAVTSYCPKNTPTRFLRLMRTDIKLRFPTITTLISYQDTRAHHGTIYKADNWRNGGCTPYRPWNKVRNRNASQSTADKIRWEYDLTRSKGGADK